MFIAEIVLKPSFHQSHHWLLDFNGQTANLSAKVFDTKKSIQAFTNIEFSIEETDIANRTIFTTIYPTIPLKGQAHGIDGMVIDIDIVTNKTTCEGSLWSPRLQEYLEFNVLFHYCWKAFYGTNTAYDVFLEQIFGYFDWGPSIIRQEEGLKIFGRLSVSDYEALELALLDLNRVDSATIDMRNFEGMGTLLFPVFWEFSQQNPKTIWLVNDSAASYLERAKIDGQYFKKIHLNKL